MTTRKRQSDALRALCAQAGEEDGQDPRYDRRERTQRAGGKDLQLCKQALRAIQLEWTGMAGTLGECLRPDRVEPAPDATRIRVWFVVSRECDGAAINRSLQSVRSRLRAAVAHAITRKRTPELELVIGPPEPARDTEVTP